MRKATTQTLREYAYYFLAWTVAGIFFFTQDLTRRIAQHDATPMRDVVWSWVVGIYISAALTPLVLSLGQRWPIERPSRASRVALHLLFSTAFAAFQIALETAVYLWLGVPSSRDGQTFSGNFPSALVRGFHAELLVYWAIIGIQAGVSYYRRYQERERQALRLELQASELSSQLMQARLSALNMQLQPHFLFNTLNAIMVLVRAGESRRAEEMLGRLGDLLRYVLDDGDAQEAPLRRELQYVELYLSIEQVRFLDRLRVNIDVDPAVLDAAVPHMGLQPLVENAVRHGIEQRSAAGVIGIRAARAGETLEIEISDDGPGFSALGESLRPGIGLSNTRARLEQLYGGTARLLTTNGRQNGATVTMILPYRPAPQPASESAERVWV